MPEQRIKWREIYWSIGLKAKQGLTKAPKEAKELEHGEVNWISQVMRLKN